MDKKTSLGVGLTRHIIDKIQTLKDKKVIKSMSFFGRDAILKELEKYEADFEINQKRITDYGKEYVNEED